MTNSANVRLDPSDAQPTSRPIALKCATKSKTQNRRLICHLIIPLLLAFACGTGCSRGDVEFEWFNLSTNEIFVTDAVGLPDQSWAGRLMPVHGEDQLSVAASTIMETVHIKDQIVIKWKENGKEGWSRGAATLPDGNPATGVAHEAAFRRADFGIPARLTHAKVRFTYLGGDKWRIKIYGPTTTFEGIDKVKDFSPPY